MKTIYAEHGCLVEYDDDSGALSITDGDNKVVLADSTMFLLITALVNHFPETLERYFTEDEAEDEQRTTPPKTKK